jgi:Spy/CpxP family protein refolding chaperone
MSHVCICVGKKPATQGKDLPCLMSLWHHDDERYTLLTFDDLLDERDNFDPTVPVLGQWEIAGQMRSKARGRDAEGPGFSPNLWLASCLRRDKQPGNPDAHRASAKASSNTAASRRVLIADTSRNLTIFITKNSMKKIAITLLASAYAAHLFAQSASPSPTDQGKTAPEPAQKSMRSCFLEGLQLTDDEKVKLKQIDDADRDGLRSAWAQVRIARESLDAALLANPENIADIQTKATNLANALSTKVVQMALHRAKINAVLTPAQRVALVDAERRRMPGWNRPRGGGERGPWQRQCPWRRQDPLPPQTPGAPNDSRTPDNQ